MQYSTLVSLVEDRLNNELDNCAHSNSVTFNANDDATPMDLEPGIPSFMQILQIYYKTIDPVHVRRSIDAQNQIYAENIWNFPISCKW